MKNFQQSFFSAFFFFRSTNSKHQMTKCDVQAKGERNENCFCPKCFVFSLPFDEKDGPKNVETKKMPLTSAELIYCNVIKFSSLERWPIVLSIITLTRKKETISCHLTGKSVATAQHKTVQSEWGNFQLYNRPFLYFVLRKVFVFKQKKNGKLFSSMGTSENFSISMAIAKNGEKNIFFPPSI